MRGTDSSSAGNKYEPELVDFPGLLPSHCSTQAHHKCSWYSNSGGGGCQEYVPRGTRVAPCCRWDTQQRGAAPWRGRDEQPSWTREQPVLLAEVVAPPLLSRGAAISGSGGAQIDRLAVKMSNRCSSGLSCCCS